MAQQQPSVLPAYKVQSTQSSPNTNGSWVGSREVNGPSDARGRPCQYPLKVFDTKVVDKSGLRPFLFGR